MTTVLSPAEHAIPTSSRSTTVRPPTLFGRQSPEHLAQAGHDLARQAIGKALEQVDHADAVGDLIRFAHSRRSVLEMAHDYLGWVRFDAPLSAQVDALFLVDRALYELEHPATAANPVVTALRARAGRVRAAHHRRRAAHHRGAPRVA